MILNKINSILIHENKTVFLSKCKSEGYFINLILTHFKNLVFRNEVMELCLIFGSPSDRTEMNHKHMDSLHGSH